MFKKYVFFAIGISFLISCSDETTVYQEPLLDNLRLEENPAILQQSVSFEASGVVDIYEPASAFAKYPNSQKAQPAGDYPLTLVAQIKAPVYEGEVLASTHIQVLGDYAYVSYNTAGELYRGAVDIINIQSPANPRLTARLIFTNADINAVAFFEGHVYLAGGVDKETSTIATSSSFIGKIEVNNGRFNLNTPPVYTFLEGAQANDVVINDRAVWTTSGTQGYISKIDLNTLEIAMQYPLNDPRSVALNGNNVAVLESGMGIVILDKNLKEKKMIPVLTDLGINSKRSIDFLDDRLVVAESHLGSGVYDYDSGNLLEYIDIPVNPEHLNAEDKVTNAAAFNDDVILMANGGAGLSLAERTKYGTYEQVGVVELNEMGGSINYVDTKNDYILAAAGKDGVQIIKFNKPSKSLVESCIGLPVYEGSAKLYIRKGEISEFSGSKRFNLIEVEGALLLCGSWTVINDVKIEKSGLFELYGSLAVGRNNRKKDIIVEENATLRIEGNLTVYGKLTMKKGSTLEFLGGSNSVDVHEKVEIEEDVTITGTFEDVRNMF